MAPGARTPEELETLFEDACIVGDVRALLSLFEPDAVLATATGRAEAHGAEQVVRLARSMLTRGQSYVADPQRMLQAGDLALSLGRSVNVLRRGPDRAWRYAIFLTDPEKKHEPGARTMTHTTPPTATPRVLGAYEGVILGPEDGVRDRFMIDGTDTGARFAVVEHLLAPRALAAPLHRHTREDEYSYVLEGRVGAQLGGQVVIAGIGDLITKPCNQWHTFWNAGDEPARVLEIISPAGLEELFRAFGAEGMPEPETLVAMAAAYGVDLDFGATMPIIEQHRLAF